MPERGTSARIINGRAVSDWHAGCTLSTGRPTGLHGRGPGEQRHDPIAELRLEAPVRYILAGHARSRLERGLAGFLVVEGADNPGVFRGEGIPSVSGD